MSGDWIERRERVVARGVARFAGAATAQRASGSRIETADGRALIDFTAGIGVVNVGHGHPRVIAAIKEQCERLIHACFHVATYEPYVALCEALIARLPHGGPARAMLVNSGAEAVENAVKIARQATGKPGILCFTEAFHGRTSLGMSLTSKTGYKTGCGPFMPEVYRLPFPNRFRYGDGLDAGAFVARELDRLREALTTTAAADNLAAVIIEAVQGEGGFVPAPPAYLQGLEALCREQGILLIVDEVQSGFGRAGAWGAYQRCGISPDLSTWAKGLGAGMPISAVVGRAEVMDAARPGTLGGTYGGNPVAAAAALASIAVIEDEGLLERAELIGARIRAALEGARCPLIAEVRGLGAMIAAELCRDQDPRRPAGEEARTLAARCLDEGLLILPCGPHGNVVRVLAPLTIPEEVLDEGLSILVRNLEAQGPAREAS